MVVLEGVMGRGKVEDLSVAFAEQTADPRRGVVSTGIICDDGDERTSLVSAGKVARAGQIIDECALVRRWFCRSWLSAMTREPRAKGP